MFNQVILTKQCYSNSNSIPPIVGLKKLYISAVMADITKTSMKVPTMSPIKNPIANNGSFKVKYIIMFGMDTIKFKMVVTTAKIKANGIGLIFFSSNRLPCKELNLSRIPPILGVKKLYSNAIIAL